MNTFKTLMLAGGIIGLTTSLSLAEGKGDGSNGFVEAAKKYEELSRKAHTAGKLKDAEIYHKLALIKLEAAKAAENGKDFSWDEYYALQKQLSTHQDKAKHHKAKHDKAGKHGKQQGGGGFNSAAERYRKLAEQARANGNEHNAKIYDRMAQIKIDAANHKSDKPFDWSEYHKLNGQLQHKGKHHGEKKHGGKNHGKHHDKDHGKKGNHGFLKAAEEYMQKANQAMQDGDEEKAKIYIQLASMKREAAAAAELGKGYDWTKYFELQKQLEK